MKRHYWTDNEVQLLTDLYPDVPTDAIAVLLNMEINTVYHKANSLGLKKSQQYLNSSYSGRLTADRRNVATQFKPGQTAWNKGMKGVNFGGTATQFKPGHQPHNTKYDNFISIRRDKSGRQYKNVRVSVGKWELLQRKTWAEHNGPIQAGMIIAFKDGDTMNCNIENLIMISMEENMIRNSIQRYPEEIVAAIRTRQSLNNRIKKLQNEQN